MLTPPSLKIYKKNEIIYVILQRINNNNKYNVPQQN